VGAAWSTGTAATAAAPTAATNRRSNTPGAPLRVAEWPSEAGKGERGVAAADGGAAPAARQPASAVGAGGRGAASGPVFGGHLCWLHHGIGGGGCAGGGRVRSFPCPPLAGPKAAQERGTGASVLWSGGGRRQGNGGRASHQAKGIRGAGGGGGSSSGHRGNAAAAVVTQSSYVRKGTACDYMSVQNSRMDWYLAHSDCVGVIRGVTLPRRNDKVKRRTTLIFGILLTQELFPFATRHAQASCACQQEVRKKKKHHVTVDRGAQVG